MLTAEERRKVEAGVRVLRESLRPLGFDVQLVCTAPHNGSPWVCDVVEPYGFSPEACCPIHDPDDATGSIGGESE